MLGIISPIKMFLEKLPIMNEISTGAFVCRKMKHGFSLHILS